MKPARVSPVNTRSFGTRKGVGQVHVYPNGAGVDGTYTSGLHTGRCASDTHQEGEPIAREARHSAASTRGDHYPAGFDPRSGSVERTRRIGSVPAEARVPKSCLSKW